MDGLGDVFGHVEGYHIGDTFREVAADLVHGLLDGLGHLHGVHAGKHTDVHHCGIAAVDTALGVVGLGLKRYAGHIAQTDDGTVRVGPEDYVLELTHSGQTALSHDRHGHVHSVHGLLAEDSGGGLAVLLAQGFLDVLHCQSETGQSLGLYPYLHTVVAAADIGHAAYARDTAEHIEHIEGRVVTQVHLVKLGVVGQQGDGHQLVGGLLVHRDTVLDHLGRKSGLGLLHSVLYLYGRQVGVGVYVKCNRDGKRTGVGAPGVHVEHTGGTVELLLDGGGYGLGYGLCVSSGVGGRDLHHRGNDLRVLVHRQQEEADEAHQHYDDGDDRGEYRPVYEEITFHSLRSLYLWNQSRRHCRPVWDGRSYRLIRLRMHCPLPMNICHRCPVRRIPARAPL